MTFEFEYLGEFKFILENNLQKESADQERAFDERKWKIKSRASVPLKIHLHEIFHFKLVWSKEPICAHE
jgi:hypothetical protein